MVVTIPSDLPLTDDERSILGKGLNFVPLQKQPDEFSVRCDINSFCRRLRLKYHFRDNTDAEPTSPDPFTNLQKKRSNWIPAPGANKVLDQVIDSITHDVERLLPRKLHSSNNITQGELAALRTLKNNRDLIIKSADKGGATVVWRRDLYVAEAERQLCDPSSYVQLDGDPTATYQKTVTTEVKSLIQTKVLPATASNLIHPGPRIPNFYMLAKSTRITNPVGLLYLVTAVLRSSFQNSLTGSLTLSSKRYHLLFRTHLTSYASSTISNLTVKLLTIFSSHWM